MPTRRAACFLSGGPGGCRAFGVAYELEALCGAVMDARVVLARTARLVAVGGVLADGISGAFQKAHGGLTHDTPLG